MHRRILPALVACATLGLAGCASTRNEAPPEVAPQPPAMTTQEVRAEGVAAENRDAIATPVAPSASPAAAAAAATAAALSASQRYRPTSRSTEEILRQNAATSAPLDFQQRVDQAHDRVYTWVQSVVERTDHRYARKDVELKPVPAAPFRLGMVLEAVDQSGGMKFALDADLDIALQLPNIEDRLRIFVTSDDLDEGPRDTRDESGLRAGLRYQLRQHLDFDVGVQLDMPPVAFASVKWTREIHLGQWDFYPLLKLFAETEEGLGYAGAATFDRWSGRHLARSSTYAKRRGDLDRTQWSQTLIYARAHELIVPDRYGSYPRARDIGAGWGLRLLASGERTNEVTYYETGVFYARPTSTRWLYWSVEPIVRWDREDDWKAAPGIRFGFNALFWDLARPAR